MTMPEDGFVTPPPEPVNYDNPPPAPKKYSPRRFVWAELDAVKVALFRLEK